MRGLLGVRGRLEPGVILFGVGVGHLRPRPIGGHHDACCQFLLARGRHARSKNAEEIEQSKGQEEMQSLGGEVAIRMSQSGSR